MTETIVALVWIAKATALLLLALGINTALRRAPAGARHVVWLSTLAALLLVPAMSSWVRLPLPVLPGASDAFSAVILPRAVESVQPPRESQLVLSQTPTRIQTSQPVETPVSPVSKLLLAWAVIAAAVIAWLVFGAIAVRGILRRARVLSDESWLNPMYDVADRLDLDHAPRLVMSADIEMPFACGVLHPTIVLPASAQQWTEERRRVVLFHELAHVRRRDLLGHTLGRIVCALYWFHPLVWSAAKQLRAESERACDDLVLACGGARASDYASHLLEIVTGVRRHGAPATALPMANKREFEGRMLAILDPAAKRGTPSRLQSSVLGVGLVALSLTIAAVSPTRRAVVAVQSPQQPVVQAPQAPLGDTATSATPSPSPLRSASPSPRPSAQAPASVSTSTSTVVSAAAALGARLGTQAATDVMKSFDAIKWGAQQRDGQPADTALLGRILRTDKDPEVRKAAAWALQGSRNGIPLLIERLKVDPDPEVREMSAWALVSMNSSDVMPVLVEALKKDADHSVRATAVWGLGHMRVSDVSVLEGAMSDEDHEVRQRALWALGHQNLESAPARVVQMLNDEHSDVRLMAAWVLGQILDRSTVPAIRDAFLKERDSETLQAEFRALLFMNDRSQAVIDRAMNHPDPELRSRAVMMIAGRGPGVWPWPWPWPDPRPEP